MIKENFEMGPKVITNHRFAEVFAAQGANKVAVTIFQSKNNILVSKMDEPAPLKVINKTCHKH